MENYGLFVMFIVVNCVLNGFLMFIFISGNVLVLVVIIRIFFICLCLVIMLCSFVVIDFFVGFVV